MNKRQCIGLLAALALSVSAFPALAQTPHFPDKPIRFVVPFPPGGSTDAPARLIGQKMAALLGQPVVIENRTGATGNIGTEFVAKAPPDGYTIVLGGDASHNSKMQLMKKPSYDPINDFTPLALLGTNTIILVANLSTPATTVKEYVDGVRAGKIAAGYGSSGIGSSQHFAGALLTSRSGVTLVNVPYRGGGQALADVLGGQIPVAFSSVSTVLPSIQAGKLRPIAVASSARYPGLPNVPTIAETYEGFEVPSWLAIFGPAKMPPEIVQQLSDAIGTALRDPEIKKILEGGGLVIPADTSAAALAALQRRDYALKGKIIRDAQMPLE